MTPYYQDEFADVTLYHGDALEILPLLPRGCAHLIVTDPPYGVGYWSNNRKKTASHPTIVGDGSTGVALAVLEECKRLLAHSRHLYAFGPFDLHALGYGGSGGEMVWDKGQMCGGDLSSPWGRSHERIAFGTRPTPGERAKGAGNHAARLRRGTVLRHSAENARNGATHPTPKPVALLRELVESSSRMGETVLDPFAGSCSTGVAAILEGRRAVLIEIEERYCAVGAERLRRVTELVRPLREGRL